jgi:DNA-directed RNA polymerase specialized sigma24 family protein
MTTDRVTNKPSPRESQIRPANNNVRCTFHELRFCYTCLSTARSDSHRKTVALDEFREPAGPAPPVVGDLELAQCIDRLPEIQRTVITLFYLEEKRVDEVARMLGIPEGTVKSHLHRARVALGEIMEERQ